MQNMNGNAADTNLRPSQVPGLIAEIRALVSLHLEPHMQRLAVVMDDQLFKLSGKASNAALESEYFLTMRLLRKEANSLKKNYTFAFLNAFDNFWHVEAQFSTPDRSKQNQQVTIGLSLVPNEVLEEELAILGMVDKGKVLFREAAFAMNQRLAVLTRRQEIRDDDSPLGPAIFCRAFAEALRPLPLELETRILIYKLYEQCVVQTLGSIYGEVNQLLVARNILPVISNSLKGSDTSRRALDRSTDGLVIPAEPDLISKGRATYGHTGTALPYSQQQFAQFFGELQELLDQWRNRVGIYPSSNDGPLAASQDVVASLSALQRSSQPTGQMGGVHKDDIRGCLSQMFHQSLQFARQEEDVIDMVGFLFDLIMEESLIPGSVKVMIARLQIPVIKAAIIDRGFFGNKSHPARLLLNALSQAGIGIDPRDTTTHKAIEVAVNRIREEFEQEPKLFTVVLDEFLLSMEKNSQRSRSAELRTLQSFKSQEQMQLCKRKVAHEIAIRIRGKSIPASIRSFVFNHWKTFMILTYLRRDRSLEDWELSLKILDQVTCSSLSVGLVKSEFDLPTLLKKVQVGLEQLSIDPMQVKETIRSLRECLGPDRLGASPYQIDNGLEDSDPDIMSAINEIAHGSAIIGSRPDISIPIEFFNQVNSLSIGQWIEFSQDNGTFQAKLSLKSQATNTLLFVNRRGIRSAEISLSELAERFAKNTARMCDVSEPFMDRALAALIKTLRGGATSEPIILNRAVAP